MTHQQRRFSIFLSRTRRTPLVGYIILRGLTVKSAYLYEQRHRLLDSGSLSAAECKRIWKLKVQHHLKLLFWKLAAAALPIRCQVSFLRQTQDPNLLKRPICCTFEDTREHLFLGCWFSVYLWRSGPWPINSEVFASQPLEHWIKFILDPSNLPATDRDRWPDLMLAVVLTVDSIWTVRNKIIHGEKSMDILMTIRSVKNRFAAHKEAWNSPVAEEPT